MSIEIDSEQGICSVEIEGSRHRAPVDSLRIGTDAEARLSVLYIDGKRLHISEEDAQHAAGSSVQAVVRQPASADAPSPLAASPAGQ
ncbi:DUF3203 family protein [Pseudomonas aeruginosa]|uniref:DUF3203 family protein n=1 Tax=Pseudomonas aeruginosa TaxID=287 RepID=UPI0003B9F2BD|nr:DUF3203 family protein [Pseudomonas aeruginosa]ERY50703.1 hypothetical protein Q057_06432 [Pseudomonas aeruginosa BL03]ERY51956.1 hypothetical protein Q057_06014 [Pseudomonas aeruginosa BL03]